MDSFRLAQYAVETPCYVCGGGNNFDAELCRHCFAPMQLAHQANSEKNAPQMVATLGTADAGKTVYLGMLMDMLSHENAPLQLLARGAFSVSLQQATMSAMSRCRFPAKTPNEPDRWDWVHCQIKSKQKKRPIELVMPDLAGEAILQEIEHPNSYPVIRSFLSKSAAALVLVDGARLERGEKDQDFYTMKMVSYLSELDNDSRQGWSHRPVAIVFTKADQCETCFDDPAQYARRQAPGLWQMCRERFQQHDFFAVGVAGACAHRVIGSSRQQVPLRVEPRGIVEPFLWLVEAAGK